MRVLLFALCIATASGASSVTDELSASSTQSTAASPRSGTVSDSLNASIELGSDWSLSLGALITHDNQPDLARMAQFNDLANDPFELFTAGVDWDATDHFNFGLTGQLSPVSTQSAVPSLTARNPNTGKAETVYLEVNSRSSEWGAGFTVGFDTAGDSPLEWAFDASLTFTSTSIDQEIPVARFINPNTPRVPYTDFTIAQIRADCQSGVDKCPARVQAAMNQTLRQQAQPLDSEKLSGAATATVATDTDLALGFDYYVYNQDPAAVGLPQIALRQIVGSGMPMAPLQFMVRSEVTHRWGGFSARLTLQVGRYAPGTGQDTSGLGLKLQYKFSKAFRLWTTLNGQRDVDQDGQPSKSGSVAMGAGYRF
jgi:hypothetical protein